MSELMTSQKMKRTCDACGASKEWELVAAKESDILEMQEWYLVTRAVVIQGQVQKIQGSACSLTCLPVVGVKLAIPPAAEEPADDIDMASLRASNIQTN